MAEYQRVHAEPVPQPEPAEAQEDVQDRQLTIHELIEAQRRRNAAQRTRQVGQDRAGPIAALPAVLDVADPDEWLRYISYTTPAHEINQRDHPLRSVKAFYSNAEIRALFPTICALALKYLSLPASEACCEKIFSAVKAVVGDGRQSLKPEIVEILTLLKINARKFAEKKFV